MAALTQERNTIQNGDKAVVDMLGIPVAAGAKILAGSLVMIDGGYAKPAATATGKLVVGRAERTFDNTGGAAGAITATVRQGIFAWDNSAGGDLIAQANVGADCYAVDDHTVALTNGGSTRSVAGKIIGLTPNGQVLVGSKLQ